MLPRSVLVLLAAIVLGAMAGAALADGCYVPQVAYPAMPTIPAQRALIVHRDGLETLVVESSFQSDSPDVGWILPLPAAPTKFAVADGGMLTSLAVCTGPNVINDLHEVWVVAIFILAFLVPLVLVAIFSENGLGLVGVLLSLVVCILVIGLTSHLGPSVTDSAASWVISTQRVGNYDISVIRAENGAGLGEWLASNGLKPLDERATAVVNDYVARGWCFAVARLHRDGKGPATPHPLAVTFPAAQPIYPMRLTAMANSKTHVELYVIADQMSGAKGFRLISADQYACPVTASGGAQIPPWLLGDGGLTLSVRNQYWAWRNHLPLDAKPYASAITGPIIGQSDVKDLMWNGCVVTRLEADLSPRDMDDDVRLSLEPLRAYRESVFSPRGRWELMLSVGLWGATPILLYCAVVCRKRRRPGLRQLKTVAILAGAVLAIAAIAGLSHRTVPVGPSQNRFELSRRAGDLGKVAQAMAYDGILHSGMTPAEQEAFPRKAVELNFLNADGEDGVLINAFTGAPMRLERSPGNYAFRRVGDETYFCLYDEFGIEQRVLALPPQAKAGEGRAKQEGSGNDTGASP